MEKKITEEGFCRNLKNIYEQLFSVRDRYDLIYLINKSLGGIDPFSHSMVSLVNKDGRSYSVFLLKPGSPVQSTPETGIISDKSYSVNDGFYDQILSFDTPVICHFQELSLKGKLPTYLKSGYVTGVDKMVAVSLNSDNQKVGNLVFFMKDKGEVSAKLLHIVQETVRLASLVVDNIIINEDMKARELEKSLLLSLSKDLSAVRDKAGLSALINIKVNGLFHSKGFAIDLIDDRRKTFRTYMVDGDRALMEHSGSYSFMNEREMPLISGLHDRILGIDDPVCLLREDMMALPEEADYLRGGTEMGRLHLMGTRLRTAGQTTGILWVYVGRYVPFSLTMAFASQIAVAVANIKANEEIGRRETEKALLLSFANELAAAKDKKQLGAVINKCLQSFFLVKEYMISVRNADGISHSFYLYDESAHFINAPGFQNVMAAKMAIAGGPVERIYQEGEPLLFDVRSILESKTIKFESGPFWLSVGIPQILGAMLSVGNENIGVLWMEPDQINRELLKAVSNQIAIAISNIVANERISQHIAEINTYKKQLEEEKLYLQEEIVNAYNHTEFVGDSQEMQKIYHLLSHVAFTNSTVLILGETGTGKELAARAIHDGSPRKDKLMIKVNCATMPASLIDSELFGHERGSFTGAFERRLGKFELANKGTLFLDEIGEMPLELQAKLLRALQEKEIERVGGKTTIKVDVRIIAATNRDLAQEVKEGRFRRDLFYRLNVFPVTLPPLRERVEDIPVLVTHFINKYARNTGKKVHHISDKALNELTSYHWPGNVRELEHLMERCVLLSRSKTISEIPFPITEKLIASSPADDLPYIKTIRENERDHIIHVLNYCKGKVAGLQGAAAWLGVPVSTLNARIKKLGIQKEMTFTKK
ncbi:sigma-54-dependent Fis family transcriptional regulator [Mucilaginibacter jinjuensis]|uniref:Sigma 54-interacting transcriptional regulator n=1 Tax=Mucilaginibacter jinjuensis TaxID=1176721 RepID=A0ABY7TCD6_9SPHI|nr:sigma 54-interacting transcriptional regulator [Mucilaginibacter jinjuensis]WCT13373.1 sigma 54-interacting transcriptional regulator [Mucilaginibacter jinjuensis]